MEEYWMRVRAADMTCAIFGTKKMLQSDYRTEWLYYEGRYIRVAPWEARTLIRRMARERRW